MREIIITNRNKTDIADEALYALSVESNEIWAEHGFDAPWMHKSLERFQQSIHSAVVFVALDAETGELLGLHCFRKHRKQGWCYGFHLAVAASDRREGIASQMLEYESESIRQAGYRYLKGVSATTAEWSVRWHLKNGYRIVGYYHSPYDNFANYVFRKQLAPSLLWGPVLGSVTAKISFVTYYLANRLLKHPDGHDNILGRMVRKMLRKKQRDRNKLCILTMNVVLL